MIDSWWAGSGGLWLKFNQILQIVNQMMSYAARCLRMWEKCVCPAVTSAQTVFHFPFVSPATFSLTVTSHTPQRWDEVRHSLHKSCLNQCKRQKCSWCLSWWDEIEAEGFLRNTHVLNSFIFEYLLCLERRKGLWFLAHIHQKQKYDAILDEVNVRVCLCVSVTLCGIDVMFYMFVSVHPDQTLKRTTPVSMCLENSLPLA